MSDVIDGIIHMSQQQSTLKGMRYSFNNLTQVQRHIERRNFFFRKLGALLERKAQLDYDYAMQLQCAIHKDYTPQSQDSMPSQKLYQQLVTSILQQSRRMRRLGQKQAEQANRMQCFFQQQNPQIKKNLLQMQAIAKEMNVHRQKIDKVKTKFQKKRKQLDSVKLQYLACLLSKQQLRKNQLYFSVQSMDQNMKPVWFDYHYQCQKYNREVLDQIDEFRVAQSKLQMFEHRKILLMKQSVLGYLDGLKTCIDQMMRDNPFKKAQVDSINSYNQISPHLPAQLAQQKHRLKIHLSKSSGYIDHLYERIQTKKNLQKIINYGKSVNHKKRISQLFDFGEGNQSITQAMQVTSQSHRMIQLYRQVFQGQGIHQQQKKKQFRDLLSIPQVRKDFILCLQKYRIHNEFQLPLQRKDDILWAMHIFMDMCSQQFDTYNSKMLMVLSLTYHFQTQNKIQLQQLIKQHSIWHNVGWWQTALIQSIYQQSHMKAIQDADQSHISIWDIKAGGIGRKQNGSVLTHQHICFNNLLYYVSNMGLFGINKGNIEHFAKYNISLLKFSSQFAKDIMEQCAKHMHGQTYA